MKMLDSDLFLKVVEVDERNRTFYIEDGGENFEKRSYEKSFSEEEVIELFKGVFYSLKYLHDRNIFHGDVKLDNMVLNPRTKQIALIDFGLSEQLDSQQPYSSQIYGTYFYIAPETHRGEEHSFPADIYAAGVAMYVLLNEDFPFEFNSSYTDYALHQINEDADLQVLYNKGISESTCFLLDKMLSRDPNERPTADQIINYLYEYENQNENWNVYIYD